MLHCSRVIDGIVKGVGVANAITLASNVTRREIMARPITNAVKFKFVI